jgi:hypothetical protein
MHPDLAKAAMAFLSRVDLKGAEAPVLMQVLTALDAFANPQPLPEPLKVEPGATVTDLPAAA